MNKILSALLTASILFGFSVGFAQAAQTAGSDELSQEIKVTPRAELNEVERSHWFSLNNSVLRVEFIKYKDNHVIRRDFDKAGRLLQEMEHRPLNNSDSTRYKRRVTRYRADGFGPQEEEIFASNGSLDQKTTWTYDAKTGSMSSSSMIID